MLKRNSLFNLVRFSCNFQSKWAHTFTIKELKIKEFGNFESGLELVKTDISESELNLKNDELFIKLVAAPIHPADINIIQGKYAFLPNNLPAILGNEGLFEVVKVNENNTNFKVGDWVACTELGWGCWRSHSIVKESSLIKIRNDLDKRICATLKINPPTAYRMLNDFIKLKPNDTVIQNGANSAVGQSVIQLGNVLKVNVVNIIRKRENQQELEEHLRSIGAEHIYTEEDLRKPALTKELWKNIPKPILGLNCVGGRATTDLVRLLDHDSVLVTYGGMSRQPLTFNTADFIFKNFKAEGFWLTSWRDRNPEEYKKTINILSDMAAEEKITAPKCEEFNLNNYKQALERAQTPYTNSKVLFID